MPLKVTGRNKELFDKNLAAVLNVACVVAMSGSIPNRYDRNGNAFSDALTQLIAVRFRDDVVVLP